MAENTKIKAELKAVKSVLYALIEKIDAKSMIELRELEVNKTKEFLEIGKQELSLKGEIKKFYFKRMEA